MLQPTNRKLVGMNKAYAEALYQLAKNLEFPLTYLEHINKMTAI